MKRRIFLRNAAASAAGIILSRRMFGADAPAAVSGSAATAAPAAPAPAVATLEEATKRLYELGKRNVAIHDPSTIVKCDGEYWIFRTGNGIPSYHSKDLLNWTPGPNVIPREGFDWFADAVPNFGGNSCWAPDCIKVGDKYFIFYSISAFGKNTSAIGLVSSPTLDPADPAYAWKDEGMVIKSVASDHYNTIDPAPVLDADGNLWLAFGSFWTGIKLIALDKKTGHRLPDSPMYDLAANPARAGATTEGAADAPINRSQIEASYIYRRGKYYYLFVNWGLCCKGLSSTYNIRVGRSEKITGPYLDKDGKDLEHNGGTLFLGDEGPLLDTSQYAAGGRGRGGNGRAGRPPAQVHAFIGPGHAAILEDGDKFWFSCHYYDGTTPNGASILAIRPLTWDKDEWPVLGEWPDPAPRPTVQTIQPGGRGRRGGFGAGSGSGASANPAAAAVPASSAASASSASTN
ncbi:MAG TPA: arabinan endo-1,5-alpha-L-arabinosidase [Opitutales bacterium]|nr:arabinan endo-1,5-alpha-L-arabinosidase [Opitutales bacterium]